MLLKSLVRFYAQRGRLILGVATLATFAAAFVAAHLTIDADLERLLPETAPSVRGLEELEEKYGIVGRVNMVLRGGEMAQLQAAADIAAEIAAGNEHIERVEVHRPVEFFQDNRLLYIDKPDLDTVSERLLKRIKWEKRRANPLFVDVSDEEPPEVEFDDIEKKYDRFEQDKYFCDLETKTCLVFAFPNFSAGDLKKSKALLRTLRAQVDAELETKFPETTLGLSGRYAKRVDQQQAVNRDLARATGIALTTLFLFLLIYFRGFLSAVWVFLPLMMGTTWAFAWAEIVFGSLNVLTSFFGAVLLGLGIDYGIHILSRYLEALETEGVEEAMIDTLRSAGRASMYAGLTTVIAFGSLMASSFRAFFEYGVIALGGMALLIVANVVVLPCILLLVAGTRFQPRGTMSVHVAQRLTEGGAQGAKTWRALLIGGIVMLLLLASVGVPQTAYEYDFRNVQSTDLESWRLEQYVDPILGNSQVPVVVLADNTEHAERIASELRRRTDELPEGDTMDRTLTLQDAVPDQQEPKVAVLQNLADKLGGLPKSVFDKNEQLRDFRDEIRGVLERGVIGPDALPEPIRAPFRRRDHKDRAVVLGFPSQRQNDVKEMERLAVVIRSLPGPTEGTTVDGINDALLLVDIFESVRRDSIWMIAITTLGLFLTAILAFRRLRKVLLLIGTIGASIYVAIGFVALFGVKFNFINMVVIPIWLGLGVDAAFHLMVRHDESPGEIDGYLATAIAVGAAFITSMIGFGAMLVTGHKGLFSLGAIAVIGLGSILATSLAIQSLILNRFLIDDE